MTAPPGDRDQIYELWRDWCDTLWHEIVRVHWQREVWTAVRDEIKARAPDEDQTFLAAYSAGYVASVLMAIRRLADTDANTRSLVSLICALDANPEVMTRTRYCEVSGDDPARSDWRPSAADFERRWASPDDPEHIDPAILERDRVMLGQELELVAAWATKTIAHLDPKRPEIPPTFKDLDDALDLVSALFSDYEMLILNKRTHDWAPALQGDWHAPLRAPLFWPPSGSTTTRTPGA